METVNFWYISSKDSKKHTWVSKIMCMHWKDIIRNKVINEENIIINSGSNSEVMLTDVKFNGC